MMAIIRIQKKIASLSNQHPYSPIAEVLEDLGEFVNKMSPYEIVDLESKTVVRSKKTLKEIGV